MTLLFSVDTYTDHEWWIIWRYNWRAGQVVIYHEWKHLRGEIYRLP